jgi:putative nucleotidyltransferase with HDIG domain
VKALGIDNQPDLSPAVQELLEGYADGRPQPLPRRERIAEAIVATVFFAIAVPMVVLLPGGRSFEPLTALMLVGALALAKRVQFAVGIGFATPIQLVFVPMLFLLPPSTVPLVVLAATALGTVPDVLKGRTGSDHFLVMPGDVLFSLGPALVIALAGAPSAAEASPFLLVGALLAQFAVELTSISALDWILRGVSPRMQPRLLSWVFAVDALLAPVGLLAAMAAERRPGAFLLALPLAGLLAIFAREREVRVESAIELGRAYRGTTLLLSDVLEADDEYTGNHSHGVVALAIDVADELGLDSRERRNVEFGALLHDVGKIAVPNEILNKPGPLTDDEWVVIKTHTVEGQRMLDRIGGVMGDVGRIVRSSHERWDGGGYPDGLAGEAIPREARIVACCDAFNAMTTDRAYRAAMPLPAAVAELRDNAGTQFDPEVADALIRVIERYGPPTSVAAGRDVAV